MLGDHQGQTAVSKNLRGHGLADVPDLGQGQLKAQAGGGKIHHLKRVHGGGVEDVQAEVSVQAEPCLPDGDHQAVVAHQDVFDAHALDLLQTGAQLGQLAVVDDSGQHGGHPAPFSQNLAQGGVFGEQVDGHIEHGGFRVHQGRSELLPGGDLDGQTGEFGVALVVGNGLGCPDSTGLRPAPQGGEAV